MTALLLRGDARALPLTDSSVDLIVTSPPYWALRSYTDGGRHYDGQIGSEETPRDFLDDLIEVTRECMRVLKPTGSIWVNLGDKYATASGAKSMANAAAHYDGGGNTIAKASRATKAVEGFRHKSLIGLPWRYALRCIDDLDLILRAEVIWAKPNGMPESVTDRVRRCHEQWFHFVLEPTYYADLDEVREEYTGDRALSRRVKQVGLGKHEQRAAWTDANALGRLPGSVWTVATEPLRAPTHLGVDHYAAFPTELPHRIVRGWSAPGAVVLDPFGGTGTTALCASALGRTGISVDLSADYCRLAKWRTTDPRQRAKAARVERPPAELDGQTDLLELA